MPYNNSDGFSGIVGAFNTLRQANDLEPVDYPASFEGIKEAVLDIKKEWGNIGTGEYPDGWGLQYDGVGNVIGGSWIVEPQDGDLWFDQRQGRMMVWLGGAFYQTNGADQLTVISETTPSSEVTGGFWFQESTGNLYIYDGSAWILAVSGGGSVTFSTSNLLLDNATQTSLGTVSSGLNEVAGYSSQTFTQDLANQWFTQAIATLDSEVNSINTECPRIEAGATEPATPSAGDLWYDTNADALKVYADSVWQSAINFTDNDADLQAFKTSVQTQQATDAARFTTIEGDIAALPFGNYATTALVSTVEAGLEADITALTNTVGDLTRFAETTYVDSADNALDARVTTLENATVDLSHLATSAELASEIATLTSQINTGDTASTTYVDGEIATLAATIPSIAGLIDGTAFSNFQNTVANTYLTKTGGVLSGTIDISNSDISRAALDFSGSYANSRNIFKLRTYADTEHYVTYGTTAHKWEYANEFGSNEDYCWKHGTNGKQFSITKDGATAKNLFIADFLVNDDNGQRTVNSIDVKSKIQGYDTTISTFTQDIADLKAGVYNSGTSSVYYGDTSPSGTIDDGDLWFDSYNLRLNVRHLGAWVFPDRVEDVALKTALHNAIDTSTDYASLKANLLTALS